MRPTLDAYYLSMAQLVAIRATCRRRAVGCVLVNGRGQVLSTGYNGVPRQMDHCLTEPCAGWKSESGKDLDLCEAVHAEQNALLQCSDVETIYTAYLTVTPCVTCVKLLLNTSCQRIIATEQYASGHNSAQLLWTRAGRSWTIKSGYKDPAKWSAEELLQLGTGKA